MLGYAPQSLDAVRRALRSRGIYARVLLLSVYIVVMASSNILDLSGERKNIRLRIAATDISVCKRPRRARNNFRIVSGHDDRPNSFLLGHVSFLAGQIYMMNYSFRGP